MAERSKYDLVVLRGAERKPADRRAGCDEYLERGARKRWLGADFVICVIRHRG